ncbi:MAG: AzlC family ABC transporter permease [Ruminococcaceae bacterium]|nr:AzlC family ABC transporter permease [Oscillospiraceae bacterium]
MKEINSFKKGITDGLPICIGYFSVSFAFGIFAVQNGLSVLEAFLISLTNLTSAGQLAAVPIIASAGTLIELAITQLVINSRYALMSVSLSQKLGPSITLPHRFSIAFGNTDEIFAVAMSKRFNVGKRYMYGLILTPIVGWTLGTVSGAIAGDILPITVTSALGVAIYGMFIAIVVPPIKKERSSALCVLLAMVLSCIFYYVPVLKNNIPSGFTIIICSVISSAILALVAPIKVEEKND